MMDSDLEISKMKPFAKGREVSLVQEVCVYNLDGTLEEVIEYFQDLLDQVPEGRVSKIDVDDGWGNSNIFNVSYDGGYSQEEIDAAKERVKQADIDRDARQREAEIRDLHKLTLKYPKLSESFWRDVTGEHDE